MWHVAFAFQVQRYFAAHFGYIFEKPKIFSWCFAQNFLILVTIGSLKKLFLPLFGTCWSNFLYILEHVPPIVGNHLIYILIFVLSFFFEKLSISVVTNEVRHIAMSAIRICAPVYTNMFICASWFVSICVFIGSPPQGKNSPLMCGFFGFKSCTIMTFMILLKPHVWGKSGSRIKCKNAFSQLDCRIFKRYYLKNYWTNKVDFFASRYIYMWKVQIDDVILHDWD